LLCCCAVSCCATADSVAVLLRCCATVLLCCCFAALECCCAAVLCHRVVLLNVLFCICWYLRMLLAFRRAGAAVVWLVLFCNCWCFEGARLSRDRESRKRAFYIRNGLAWLCGGLAVDVIAYHCAVSVKSLKDTVITW
jgi:hypothetical protein